APRRYARDSPAPHSRSPKRQHLPFWRNHHSRATFVPVANSAHPPAVFPRRLSISTRPAPPRSGKSSLLSCFLLARLSPRGMHHPRYSNAQNVEPDHGRGENAHIHHVRRGRNDGCDYEDGQNGIANIPPKPARAHNSHEREKKNQNGQLEDYAQP